jgi:hypothetical protein
MEVYCCGSEAKSARTCCPRSVVLPACLYLLPLVCNLTGYDCHCLDAFLMTWQHALEHWGMSGRPSGKGPETRLNELDMESLQIANSSIHTYRVHC